MLGVQMKRGAARRLWVARMSVATVVFGWFSTLLSIVVLTMGLWSIFGPDQDRSGVLGVIMGLGFFYGSVNAFLRPQIVARAGGVMVRNPVFEYWLPWRQVASVTADMRVVIVTTDDRVVVGWAVQKTNAAAVLGRQSRTDRVAERLTATWDTQIESAFTPESAAESTRRMAVPPPWVHASLALYILLAIYVTVAD